MGRKRINRVRRLALAACAAVVCAFVWLLYSLGRPYARFEQEMLLDVPRGAGTRKIAAMLEQAGVIRSRWQLLAVQLLRPRSRLQAGEYRFGEPASAFRVFDRLARGDVFYYEVTFPEGSNIFDIGGILEQHGLITAREFRMAAANPALIRDLAAAPSLEGYLFPATYRITRHTTAMQLARDMTDAFRRAWRSLGGRTDVHRTVTLASLVEKEAALDAERPLVASVYRNRLARGMRLDCDPTTIYAAMIEGRWRGVIHRSDLESAHLYNTYQHDGLPPGPIANPGLKALEAALQPAETGYLYFVVKGNGSSAHVFSTNIEAHNRAVAEYRRGQQKGKTTGPATGVSRARKARGD